MPTNIYGIDAYQNWNSIPLGGGSGIPYPSSISADIIIDSTTSAPITTLLNYLKDPSNKNTNVFVKIDIDLTGYNNNPIVEGITLYSYRGHEMYVGACLFTTDSDVDPLFKVMGPGVKIQGLRFGGYDLAAPDFSPPGTSCAIKSSYAVEIENCEFYGWGKAAIMIEGIDFLTPVSLPTQKLYPTSLPVPPNVYIHHCYIHHCLNLNLGYGIHLNNCFAKIYANIFDYNTHSIYSTGLLSTSFEAYWNFVLSNAQGSAFSIGQDDQFDNSLNNAKIYQNTFWSSYYEAIHIKSFTNADIYWNVFAKQSDAVFIESSAGNNFNVHDNIFGQYVPVSNYGIEAYNDWYDIGPVGGGDGYKDIIDINNVGSHYVQHIFYSPGITSYPHELLAKLNYAFSYSPCIIFIDSAVEINLTGFNVPIQIPPNTILCSDRGNNGSKGALIFTTTLDLVTTNNSQAYFIEAGNNVRITGLRIAGSYQDRAYNGASKGIFALDANIEVDNCELYGWEDAAIRIDGSDAANAPTAKIHHNYIHHTQGGSAGYGVAIDICDAVIEANIFDYNRHSVKGGGENGCSYEAKYNLQLNNVKSHAWDVHDFQLPAVVGHVPQPNFCAGTRINIHHNTFLLWKNVAIEQGLPPVQYTKIYRNFFAQPLWFYRDENLNNDYINPINDCNPIAPNMTIGDNKYGHKNIGPAPLPPFSPNNLNITI